ncbi:MAG: CBS domain-containing protein [Pseudomonadota bacterium]
MAPASYRPPLKIDDEKERTYTQTTDTNMASGSKFVRVTEILSDKGATVHSVGKGETLQEAINALKTHKIGAIVVMEEGAVVGILSERDAVRVLGESGAEALTMPVSQVMTPDPVTCGPSDPLLKVLKAMSEGGFRHMPVADVTGKLLGLISIRDVVAYRLREIEYEALQMKQMIIG